MSPPECEDLQHLYPAGIQKLKKTFIVAGGQVLPIPGSQCHKIYK